MKRRVVLHGLGMTAAGLLAPRAGRTDADGDLEELARKLRRAPREGAVLDVAARAARAGAGWEGLLGAVFLAGIRDVAPDPVGGALHCVMMVESAFQIAERSDETGALLAALWNVDEFKASQERDRRAGDWTLPPPPAPLTGGRGAAGPAFDAAMQEWDEPAALQALAALMHAGEPLDALFERIWPFALRCPGFVGHKIIFAAHVERVLRRIGRRYQEPSLLSLVSGLLKTDRFGRNIAAWERARPLARSMAAPAVRRDTPEESLAVLRALRTADPDGAQDLVLAASREGVGEPSIWDGLRLFAAELFGRRPSSDPTTGAALLPVHPVTEINAFGHIRRTTRKEETRRLALLQAAGWLPLLRDHLKVRVDLSMDGDGIDAWSRDTAVEASRLRPALLRKGVESHQYKYAAALEEEVALTLPRWRRHLLAPARPYLPGAESPDGTLLQPSLKALRAAGFEV